MSVNRAPHAVSEKATVCLVERFDSPVAKGKIDVVDHDGRKKRLSDLVELYSDPLRQELGANAIICGHQFIELDGHDDVTSVEPQPLDLEADSVNLVTSCDIGIAHAAYSPGEM